MSQEIFSQKSTTKVNHIASYVVLRGGRLAKMGKRVASFAPVLGLVGAAAVFGSSEAHANQCGTMPAGGGEVICDTTTYGTVNGAPSELVRGPSQTLRRRESSTLVRVRKIPALTSIAFICDLLQQVLLCS
jgi:hypothetical protein